MKQNEFNQLPDEKRQFQTNRHRRVLQQKPPQSGNNTLAIVALIFGLLSWFILPFIGALVAIVTGHIARSQIKHTDESGSGLALTGLILGYLNCILFGLAVIAAITLPAYQDYVYRVKTREAAALLEPYRMALAQKQPENQEIAISNAAREYWQNIRIENETLIAQFGNGTKVPSMLRNESLFIRAEQQNQQIVWHCEYSVQVKPRMLPHYCQGYPNN